MKCPKCGYTSFDFLENCKKCGNDLQDHKQKFGLRSLIFPGFQKAEPAPSLLDSEEEQLETPAAEENGDFGFDFMDDEQAATDTAAGEAESGLDDGGGFAFGDGSDPEAADDLFVEDSAAIASAAEAPDDDIWGASEDEQGAELDAAEEEEDEFPPAGDDIDFDNWEEEPEDSKKEGPSDPFDFRESAQDEQIPAQTITDEETTTNAAVTLTPIDKEESVPADDVAPVTAETVSPSSSEDEFVELNLPEKFDPVESVIIPSELPADEDDDELPVAVAALPPEDDAEPLLEDLLADEPVSPVTAAPQQEELFLETGPQLEEGEALFDLATPAAALATDESPIFEDETEEFAAELEYTDLEEAVAIPALRARMFACATDIAVLAVIFILFLMVGELTVPSSAENRLFPALATLVELAIPYFLVLFALCFGYFTLFHFLTGQTPGKMLFKLRVESITGEQLLLSQAFLRSTGGLFSVLACGLGYLVALFNSKGRGWNDQLAGSRLVPIYAEEINEADFAPLEA